MYIISLYIALMRPKELSKPVNRNEVITNECLMLDIPVELSRTLSAISGKSCGHRTLCSYTPWEHQEAYLVLKAQTHLNIVLSADVTTAVFPLAVIWRKLQFTVIDHEAWRLRSLTLSEHLLGATLTIICPDFYFDDMVGKEELLEWIILHFIQ